MPPVIDYRALTDLPDLPLDVLLRAMPDCASTCAPTEESVLDDRIADRVFEVSLLSAQSSIQGGLDALRQFPPSSRD